MAYEKQFFEDGQVLKAEHLNHMEEGFENLAFEDLKDKPFGDVVYADQYSFDSMPDVSFDFAEEVTFYKVSDLMLSYDQLLKTVFTVTSNETVYEFTPTAEDFMFIDDAVVGFSCDNLPIGVAYATGSITTDLGSLNPPETGIYMGFPLGATSSAAESIAVYCKDVKKLDEKYLPVCLPQVESADNGKMLQVVDGVWTAVAITNGNEVAY